MAKVRQELPEAEAAYDRDFFAWTGSRRNCFDARQQAKPPPISTSRTWPRRSKAWASGIDARSPTTSLASSSIC